MAVFKLKARILPSFVLASLLLFVFLLVMIYREESGHLEDELQRNGNALQKVYAAQLRTHAEKMQAALGFLVQDAELRSAFTLRDRQRLLTRAEPIFAHLRRDLNITHFYFLDPRRECFLRVHQPPRHGDLIDRYTARQAERSGTLAYGAELGPLGTFTLRVVLPWYVEGELLGYLELGEEVEALFTDVAAAFGSELLLLIDKHYINRADWEAGMRMLGRAADWDLRRDAVVSFHTLPRLSAQIFDAGHKVPLPTFGGSGAQAWSLALPLRNADERAVGKIIVQRDISQRSAQLFDSTLLIALVAALVGLLLFTSYYLILGRAERQMADWEVRLRREAEEREQLQAMHIRELEHAARYDALTDLPNRKLLQEHIAQAITAAAGSAATFALVAVELYRLREVNDTLGHEIGDLLLQQIAVRLRQELRPADVLARPGGGEFLLLLADVDREMALSAAQGLHALLSKTFETQDLSLDIGATLGIALYPEHGADAGTLLRRVDVALRHAKRTREGYAVYASEHDPHNLRRLQLFGELRKVIHNGALQLHYQPQLVLASGRVERVEALARWQHPEFGSIAPDEFIPLAEDTGLIRPFTTWVLNEALRQCRAWQEQGLHLQMAVNLSAHNLLDDELPVLVAGLLAQWQLDSGQLSLEITESAFMQEPARALDVVHRLRDMGLSLSIDDFGTGYSSLAYLKRLPLAELKIDRSFVGEMLQDENDAMIVASTIDLAHDLGLTVVAEGVESAAIQQALAARGCDVIQGYHLSKPLPAPALEAWLHSRRG